MPRILIANFNNEAMVADHSDMSYELACFSSIVAAKHMWFAQPGDIVVLPEPLSEPMAQYASSIKGFSIDDEVTFISPRPQRWDFCLVDFACLYDSAFRNELKSLMGEGQGWTLLPYYYDRSIAALARALNLPVQPQAEAFRLSGGDEFFNDKKAFRSLAAGRGIPLPDGEVCGSQLELIGALHRLLPQTGAVIVKQNRHANTLGNLILSYGPVTHCQGARDVLYVECLGSVEGAGDMLWDRLAGGAETHLVVESYYSVQAICYAEFEITEAVRSPLFLNWGDQRMEPTFAGLEIPSTLPPYQAARFLSGASDLARLAKDTGFLGFVNIDGIVTESGAVLYNEVNGRFGGSSYVHYLAKLLIGPDYGDKAIILIRNKVPAPRIDEALDILKAEGLAFSRDTHEGIIITGEDTARTGCLGCMTIGATRASAEALESKFTECMALACNDEPVAPQSLGTTQVLH